MRDRLERLEGQIRTLQKTVMGLRIDLPPEADDSHEYLRLVEGSLATALKFTAGVGRIVEREAPAMISAPMEGAVRIEMDDDLPF